MTSDTASEAYFLLNEFVRQLATPKYVFHISGQWENLSPVPEDVIGAFRQMALAGLILNLYRLHETRTQFLVPFLFSELELSGHGFRSVEEFVGAEGWKDLLILRHQFAGHATAKAATGEISGHILPPDRLGKAIRGVGLKDPSSFLARIDEELLPSVEKVRDILGDRFPYVREYLKFHVRTVEQELIKNE